jgi:hypothetical protein
LRIIARELAEAEREHDWTMRENVRANIRVIVRRIVQKYGYPPDFRSGRPLRSWSRRKSFGVGGVTS